MNMILGARKTNKCFNIPSKQYAISENKNVMQPILSESEVMAAVQWIIKGQQPQPRFETA